jgi:hypothetical protein
MQNNQFVQAANERKNKVGKSKVSDVLPFLQQIAAQWGLRLNNLREFNICRKILTNSLQNN